MNIYSVKDAEALGEQAAAIVLDEVKRKPNLLLCAATGNSPLPLYQRLEKVVKNSDTLFQKARVIPLDEWIGLSSSEGSCDSYLQKWLLKPLKIYEENYFAFNPLAENMEAECSRIHEVLKKQGPIDLCALGLGKNGHLGFNEPSTTLNAHCHVANLTAASQQHAMISNAKKVPITGLTLGMQDILNSKRILLLISGKGKEAAKEQLFSKQINTQCPASLLWQHDHVDCMVVD